MIESLSIAAAAIVLLLALSMVSLLIPTKRPAAVDREVAPATPNEEAVQLTLELAVRLRAAEATELPEMPQLPDSEADDESPAGLHRRLAEAAPKDWIAPRSGLFRRQRIEEALRAAAVDRPDAQWLLIAAGCHTDAAWAAEKGEVAVDLEFRKVAARWAACVSSFAIAGELSGHAIWFAIPLNAAVGDRQLDIAQWLRGLNSRLREASAAADDQSAVSTVALKAWRCTAGDQLEADLVALDERYTDASDPSAGPPAAEWHWDDAWLPLDVQFDAASAPQMAESPAAVTAEAPAALPQTQSDEPPQAVAGEPARVATAMDAGDEAARAHNSRQDDISEMFASRNRSPVAEPPEDEDADGSAIAQDLREIADTTAQGIAAPRVKRPAEPPPTGPLNADDIARLFAAAEAAGR